MSLRMTRAIFFPVALLERFGRVGELTQDLGARARSPVQEVDVSEGVVAADAEHAMPGVLRHRRELWVEIGRRRAVDRA